MKFLLVASLCLSSAYAVNKPSISDNGKIGTFKYQGEQDLNRGTKIEQKRQEQEARNKRSFENDIERVEEKKALESRFVE